MDRTTRRVEVDGGHGVDAGDHVSANRVALEVGWRTWKFLSLQRLYRVGTVGCLESARQLRTRNPHGARPRDEAEAARETRRRDVSRPPRAELPRAAASARRRSARRPTRVGGAQETVYKSFRGKAGRRKPVYDVTLAWEMTRSRPSPRGLRPCRAAAPTTGGRLLRRTPRTPVPERPGPARCSVRSSRPVAPAPRSSGSTASPTPSGTSGRRIAVEAWDGHGWLRPGLSTERARDIVWMVNSPAVLPARRGAWLDRGRVLRLAHPQPAEPGAPTHPIRLMSLSAGPAAIRRRTGSSGRRPPTSDIEGIAPGGGGHPHGLPSSRPSGGRGSGSA